MPLVTRFTYNLPISNHVNGLPDEMIEVTAVLNDDDSVTIKPLNVKVKNEEELNRALIVKAREKFLVMQCEDTANAPETNAPDWLPKVV